MFQEYANQMFTFVKKKLYCHAITDKSVPRACISFRLDHEKV